MDEYELDYPEEDLDRMLDDELEIMRDIENERNKENEPVRRSLEFGPRGDIKPTDGNVGIGKLSSPPRPDDLEQQNSTGTKRLRSEEEEWAPISSPGQKRLKTNEVLTEIHPFQQSQSSSKRFPRMGERKIYRHIPDSDFQAITLSSGERFYLRVKSEEPTLNKQLGTNLQPVGLCGVPFNKLQEEAEKELRTKQVVEPEEITDSGIESGDEEPQTDLWVEKFKPRSYLDLLSDDGSNRILLQWLKLWDKLVFNKEKVVKPKPEEQPTKFQSILPEIIEELDDAGRPKQRVAILHGPPGLGKTTLAHIVAIHAGYKVVEMNASDDRSVDAFKKKLESSTQMRSVISADQRPNCLIIDEIDGAPAPTINYLVSVLTGKQQGKKKDKSMQVLRPIICICNELYTPALRPLRQLGLVIPLPPTASTRLAGRLKEIAGKENVKTDVTALLALCRKTDNDIRSCLSTLQFFKSRGKMLTSSDIEKMSVGVKDSQKSLFNVWSDIFSIPSASDKSYKKKDNKDPSNTLTNRFKSVLSVVSSCGESDKIMTGVFENYLEMKFKDVDLVNVVRGGEWFAHFDLIHQEIRHSQNYAMMGHLNFPILASHFLFASVHKPKVAFPTQLTELKTKLTTNGNILETVMSEMSPSARSYISQSRLALDVLPALLTITQPVFRPINTQLYSSKEKAELKNLVDIHIAYNITYVQQRNMEGQYEYSMDPDVEKIASFPGVPRNVRLTYASKQLVSHEIELEKMRRTENRSSSQVGTPTRRKHPSGKSKKETPSQGSKTTTSHLAKLTPKQIVVKDVKAKDFFGRVIEVTSKKSKATINDEIVKTDVWFRFKEGFSNAVRRNVKMKDLL